MNLTQNGNTPPWMDGLMEEAWKKAEKILKERKRIEDFSKYKEKPIEFCQDVFGEHYIEDIKDVADSVLNNVVTIAKSANAVGKSHIAARLAIWFFFVYPDAKVYITAAPPLDNLRQILWGEMLIALKKRPSLVANCKLKSGNQLIIQRGPENFIAGMAIPQSGTSEEREAKFSGKHAPHLMFIIDEGDAVPDEVYKGIDSCMSGGEMTRMLIMFNPRAKVGPVYYKESHGQAHVVQISALRHPNVIEGKDIIPGAVTRTTTIRRIHMWTRELGIGENPANINSFVVPEFLADQEIVGLDGKKYPPLKAGEIRAIVEPSFNYMVLGEYPAQGSTQLISEVWIDAARSRWDLYVAKYGEVPPIGVRPTMGLDLAEYGSDSNVAFLRYGGFVAKPVVWQGMDIDASAEHALKLYKSKNVNIVMVDATGVGSGVAPAMARKGRNEDVRAVAVKVGEKPTKIIKSDIGDFQLLKDQLWWAMREWFRTDDTAMIPPDPMLIEELKAVQYEVTNYGKIKITPKDLLREKLKRSPDRSDALTLTFAPFERAKWRYLEQSE